MTTLLDRLPFTSVFRARRPSAPRNERPAPVPGVPLRSTRDLELDEIRGAAMRRMFPKLFSWCADRWDRGMAVEVHAYLAGARTVQDLEERIRIVERKRHFAS